MSNGIKEKCVRNHKTAIGCRRTKLGHHTIALRDQHGLPTGREPDELAELVLEKFDANRPHRTKVATGSHLVNSGGVFEASSRKVQALTLAPGTAVRRA